MARGKNGLRGERRVGFRHETNRECHASLGVSVGIHPVASIKHDHCSFGHHKRRQPRAPWKGKFRRGQEHIYKLVKEAPALLLICNAWLSQCKTLARASDYELDNRFDCHSRCKQKSNHRRSRYVTPKCGSKPNEGERVRGQKSSILQEDR
jgi:hypothetical protein